MVRNFGVDKLEAKHFKWLLTMYVDKILRLRQRLGEVSLEEQEFLNEKIQRLKAKAFAVVKEFLTRIEIVIDPEVYDDGEKVDLRAPCPKCGIVISLVKSVTIDFVTREIYLKCPNCGVESGRLSIG